MVFSMHPHVIAENGHDCLYMQETWLVGPDGGDPALGPAVADLRAAEHVAEPMEIVAYQGEPGAYSEQGAIALFAGAEHRPQPSIRTVFESVEVGRAAWGLVPMDNSQAGSINETYDLFLRHGLHLVGETVVRVDHSLLALPGSTIDTLGKLSRIRRRSRSARSS